MAMLKRPTDTPDQRGDEESENYRWIEGSIPSSLPTQLQGRVLPLSRQCTCRERDNSSITFFAPSEHHKEKANVRFRTLADSEIELSSLDFSSDTNVD